jgi:hypothetical protein
VRGIVGLEDEHGLRDVELAGDPLHLFVAQPLGIQEYGERIAAEDLVGEHVGRVEAVAHDLASPWAPASCGGPDFAGAAWARVINR